MNIETNDGKEDFTPQEYIRNSGINDSQNIEDNEHSKVLIQRTETRTESEI